MTEKDRDLMERYIYEVVRRVPKGQREEIQMELEELITDMMEKREKDNDNPIQEILTELGNPKDFAQKYNGEHNYLIGPEYMEDYCWVVKVALLSAVLFNLGSAIVQAVFSPNLLLEITYYVKTIFANTLMSMIGSFGIMTFIFAILEHQNVKLEIRKEKEWSAQQLKSWSPAKLPSVPEKKARISRGDCVVGIVCTILFALILAFVPEWIMGIQIGKNIEVVSPFNLDSWNIILPILLVSLGVELVDEIIKLVTGRYCSTVMVSGILSGMAEIVLSILVLKVFPFWNPNFIEELEKLYKIGVVTNGDFTLYWSEGMASNILLTIIIIITLAEMGVTIYKTYRYGK